MKFDSEDFRPVIGDTRDSCERAAQIANEMLESWLKQAPTLYGIIPTREPMWHDLPDRLDNHKAKLVQIEKL